MKFARRGTLCVIALFLCIMLPHIAFTEISRPSHKDMMRYPLHWECLHKEDRTDLSRGTEYQLGAFLHYGSDTSLRLQYWDDWGSNAGQFSVSVGITIIPYIQKIGHNEGYFFVPDIQAKPKKSKGYFLACSPLDTRNVLNHPEWYPSVLLTPKKEQEATTALQAQLKTFLQRLPTFDFYRASQKPLAVRLSYYDGLVHYGGGKKLHTLKDILKVFFREKKTALFLDGWKQGEIYLAVFEKKNKNMLFNFTYHPKDIPVSGSPLQTSILAQLPLPRTQIFFPTPIAIPRALVTATETPISTPSPIAIATATPTATPSPTATATATPTATPSPIAIATATPTATPSPIAIATATPTATPSPTATATATPTTTPSPTATATATPTTTPSPIATATATPTATPSPTATATPTPLPPKFPAVVDPGNVPYDSSSKFVLFFNREACERSSLTEADLNFYLYTAAMMNDIQAPENVYALVAKGDKRLTACVPGQKDGERIVFQMHSNVVAGKRLVMVVENSQGLSAAGGKHIKRGIMRWLQELKELERSLPLSLFVVRGGNDVQEFLRGEDLSRLPFESQNDALPSLVGLVSEYLNFIGQGFQPLHNLAHIGQKTMQDGVKKVLYLTDSYGIPDTIDDSQVGTLLGWKLDGVEVTVLTNGDCAKWDYKHLVNCEQLPQILTETFMKNRLKNWLN